MIRTVRDIERTFEKGQEQELRRWHRAWLRSDRDDTREELFQGFEGTAYFEGDSESWETAWDNNWAAEHFSGSHDYFCESTKRWNDSLDSMLKKLAEAGWVRIVLLPARHKVEVHNHRAEGR
jgi:hypothetical protein